jgi:hypothetical protein
MTPEQIEAMTDEDLLVRLFSTKHDRDILVKHIDFGDGLRSVMMPEWQEKNVEVQLLRMEVVRRMAAPKSVWVVRWDDDDPDHEQSTIACWRPTKEEAEAERQRLVDEWHDDPIQQWTHAQADEFYSVEEVPW